MQDLYFDKFRASSNGTMHDNNDGNKFIIIIMALTLSLLASVILCGCRSSRVEDRTHLKTDTTAVVSSAQDSMIHNTILLDSTYQSTARKDTTYNGHYEKTDTLYKSFTDKWTHTIDSIAIDVDSTGQYTLHYYTRTHERDVQHDTIIINNVVRDTLYRKVTDNSASYRLRLERDSLLRIAEKRDSIYHALRDSIDSNTEVTITETVTSWWQRFVARLDGVVIGAIAVLAFAAYVYFKKR